MKLFQTYSIGCTGSGNVANDYREGFSDLCWVPRLPISRGKVISYKEIHSSERRRKLEDCRFKSQCQQRSFLLKSLLKRSCFSTSFNLYMY